MATLFTDAFTNATDPIELSAHDATWVKHPTTSSYTIDVTGGKAKPPGTNLAMYYANVAIGSADYSVQAVLTAGTAGAGITLQVAGRMDPTNATCYTFRHRNGLWQLAKTVNGTATAFTPSYAETLNAGDVRTMKLEMIGTTLNGYVDGTLRCTATDSEITPTGYAGLRFDGVTAGDGGVDDFLVDGVPVGAPLIGGGDDASATLGRALILGVGR